MNLVVIAAFVAVCGAAKLDRTYLPPSSAESAGGSPGSLQAPLTRSSEQAPVGLPTGSYTNGFEGVVVDAASPGTRASADGSQSGLGGPRPSYGSTDSKVGDAAFRGSVAGFRGTPSFGAASSQNGHEQSASFNTHNNLGPNSFTLNGEIDTQAAQGFPSNGQEVNGQIDNHAGQFSNSHFQGFDESKSERPQAAKDRNSNILTLSNDVNTNSYSYGFESDNGIAVGENGVAANGIQAEGGYSYQGDDGQVYKVTYTADEGGYRPQGAHLPTPPPIPEEILKSLEQNAKEEAAGIVDDGSYDAQKYNGDGDYMHGNSASIQHNGAQFGKRPESNIPIGAFNQNTQAYGKPEAPFGAGPNAQNTQAFIGQSTQGNGNAGLAFGIISKEQNDQSNHNPGSAQFGVSGSQPAINGQHTQVNNRPGSTGFGSGSQSTHSTFEQSSFGNQFNPKPAFTQNGNSGSQGSHSSQPQSGHEGSTSGPTFGQNIQNQFSPLSDQASGSSGNQAQSGLQYGQQTTASVQSESHSSESSSQQNQQQFNAQFGSKPSSLAHSYSQGTGNIQSTQPQFGSSFKPQGSEAFSGASLNQEQDSQDFGKPSPQTFTGQNYNRPAVGNVNEPSFAHGQKNKESFTANGFNRFSQASSQVGAANDNPTFNFNGQSQPEKSKVSTYVFPSNYGTSENNFNHQGAQQNYQTPDFVTPGKKPGYASASASTSFSKPAFQLQSDKTFNKFNTQSQIKPSQLNQQQNTHFTEQTNQLSSQAQFQFNTNSQYSGQSVSDFGSKPTVVPDTELTTPLQPHEQFSSQGSQFPIQTTSSFGPTGNQAQTQFGQKGNSAFGQPTSQTTSIPFNSPFATATTQASFQSSVGNRPVDEKPKLSKNTQQNQSFDNSYYYKKPSIISPSVMSQGSKFPVNSQTYQSTTSVDNQSQLFSQQSFQSPSRFPGSPSFVRPTTSTQFAQTQGYSGITQAAISSFPSVSPTPSSLNNMVYNGQFGTQPSSNQQSSLGIQGQSPGAKPFYDQQSFGVHAQVTGNKENVEFPLPSGGHFPLKPISQIDEDLGSQVSTQFEKSKSTPDSVKFTQSQQHQGTIYEYNKPAEVLPVPSQTDSSSSQSIQAGIRSEPKPSFSQSQENQLAITQNSKPASSFGTQNALFGGKPSGVLRPSFLASQEIQTPQQTGIQFGSQQAQPFNAPSSTNIQFGQPSQSEAQPAKPFGTTSATHFGSMHLGSSSQSTQSSFKTKPQVDRQTSQFSHNFGNSRPFQHGSGLGSQSIQESGSNQANGYIYPGNPKPQFDEVSKNQFNHSMPSVKPQSGGLNQLNQNTHSGHSQTMSLLNRPSSDFNSSPAPQFSQSQGNQLNQATFGQRAPSPIQPFIQQEYSHPTPSASSQVVASGQSSASASASISPQKNQPYGLQNKNQFGQKIEDQNRGQSQELEAQNQKPFDSLIESDEAPSSKPFGPSAQGAKPLFESACCKSSKDSTPAQSVDRPSQASFQGTQSLNTPSFAGKGEQFGGPRQPPSFDDQTGYHY